jgi:hypothetical protein
MVATAVFELDQVPPEMESANVVEEPAHITIIPVMADGSEFTVTPIVA